jgi:hypothetical protein
VFAEKRQHENVPTTADRFAQAGVLLRHASLDRAQGYRALYDALDWRAIDEIGIVERDPRVRFMDTVGNRRLFAQLQAMVMDPDDPEKVLKATGYRVTELPNDPTVAPPGDDGYDALRYLIASRPSAAPVPYMLQDTTRANMQVVRVMPALANARDDDNADAWGWS